MPGGSVLLFFLALTPNTCLDIIFLKFRLRQNLEVLPLNLEAFLRSGIAALLPVYEEGQGNVTYLITSDGEEHLIPKTVKTVLKRIASAYGADLSALRKNYGKAVNRKNYVPIPLSSSLILIPVKFRERPLSENDGTVGYLSYYEIREVSEEGQGSRVKLSCGREIKVLLAKATLIEYMKDARLIAGLYEEKQKGGPGRIGEDRSPYGERELLREELLKLLLQILAKGGGI